MFVTPAYAQAAGGSAAAGLGQFVVFIPVILIMYFMIIRPQQKRAKDLKAMIEAVRRGDQVLTAGGIIGKVTKVGDDNVVEIEIAEGVKVKVIKQTITQVMSKTEPAAA